MALHLGPLAVVGLTGSIANASVMAVEALAEPGITSYVGAGSSALMASVILLMFRSLMNGTLIVRQAAATEETLKRLVEESAGREQKLHELVNRLDR